MNADQKYINRCFELAQKGAGYVSPNPLVGAALVKNNQIIGEGFHRAYGQPHAEVEAINNATEPVDGATLYCNLEPCCHTKKQTPPCVPLIIRKGISRVVISNIDPNPAVSGKGMQELKNTGIETEQGVLNKKGWELNRYFFTFMKKKRPFIILKIAQSLDGKIAAGKSQRTAISGKEANEDVHRLRSQVDAVLIGANTVNTDDPLLTVRHVKGRNPLRIIIDGSLNSNPRAKIYSGKFKKRTIVIASDKIDEVKRQLFVNHKIRVHFLSETNQGRLSLEDIIQYLYEQKILSVMVEGGRQIFSQFITSNFYDEIMIYQAPLILGDGVKAFDLAGEEKVQLQECKILGQDIKMVLCPVL